MYKEELDSAINKLEDDIIKQFNNPNFAFLSEKIQFIDIMERKQFHDNLIQVLKDKLGG